MRGFTIIELIVVMLVMGVLAALAAPRLTDRVALQERAVQDQLRGLLRSSRQLAVTQTREVCVLRTANSVLAVYTAAGACASALPVAGHGGQATLRIDAPPGVTLGGAALLRFNTRGQPVPAADQTLSVGALLLTVHRETGFVR